MKIKDIFIVSSYILLVLYNLKSVAQNFINPSLEDWGSEVNCSVNISPDNWTNYSTGGSGADEGDFLICGSSIPSHASDGHTYARCLAGTPIQGEGMYQNVSGFIPGSLYDVTFDYCGSNLYGGNSDCVWKVFIDDTLAGQSPQFSSLDSVWLPASVTFTATDTVHKIGIRALAAAFGSSGSAGIDNLSIAPSKLTQTITFKNQSTFFYPNPANDYLYFNNKDTKSISVYSVDSRLILCQKFSSEIYDKGIYLGFLKSGIYLIETITNNGFKSSGKLMKN